MKTAAFFFFFFLKETPVVSEIELNVGPREFFGAVSNMIPREHRDNIVECSYAMIRYASMFIPFLAWCIVLFIDNLVDMHPDLKKKRNPNGPIVRLLLCHLYARRAKFYECYCKESSKIV